MNTKRFFSVFLLFLMVLLTGCKQEPSFTVTSTHSEISYSEGSIVSMRIDINVEPEVGFFYGSDGPNIAGVSPIVDLGEAYAFEQDEKYVYNGDGTFSIGGRLTTDVSQAEQGFKFTVELGGVRKQTQIKVEE